MLSKSDHGLAAAVNAVGARRVSRSASAEAEAGVLPYSSLKILRSIDASPTSALSPAGIAGPLKITICIIGPTRAGDMNSTDDVLSKDSDLNRKLDYRYCILLDGIFTFLPPSVFASTGGEVLNKKNLESASHTKTRAVGSMENRSIFLSGYVIRKTDANKISLKGSKGEHSSYLLEASSPEECQRWLNVISAHVEHVDNKAGSKWIF